MIKPVNVFLFQEGVRFFDDGCGGRFSALPLCECRAIFAGEPEFYPLPSDSSWLPVSGSFLLGVPALCPADADFWLDDLVF